MMCSISISTGAEIYTPVDGNGLRRLRDIAVKGRHMAQLNRVILASREGQSTLILWQHHQCLDGSTMQHSLASLLLPCITDATSLGCLHVSAT